MRLLTLFVIGGAALAVTAAPAQATALQSVVIKNEITLGPAPGFFASGPFRATGPLCPSGQSADIFRFVVRTTATEQDILVGKRFTCDDGSGTFDIGLAVHVVFVPFSVNFVWKVLRGTGAYKHLEGLGRGTGVRQPSGILLDTYTGAVRVHD
jgi:hypothetical protein